MRQFGDHYGGYVVPDELLTCDSIVYSFGLGENATFDTELFFATGCEIHIFDPTPRSIVFFKKNLEQYNKLIFHEYGIWNENGQARFYAPKDEKHVSCSILNIQETKKWFFVRVKPLSVIMKELGHDHIDLLKMDIEGAEIEVIPDMIRSQIFPRIICVEFHGNVEKIMVSTITNCGYEIIHSESNLFTFKLKEL